MTSRITARPNPATPGKTVEICYEFPPGATDDAVISLSWLPAAAPTTITLTVSDCCQTVNIPPETASLTLSCAGTGDVVVNMNEQAEGA